AHELEELRPLSALVEVASPRLHRGSARVRLGTATTAARTDTPTELHDGVAQLAGGSAALPSPAGEHDASADAGAPPDGEKGREVAARSELELRGRGDCDVIRHLHAGSGEPSELLGKGIRIDPTARQVRVESDSARGCVDGTRRSDADS